jgi:hypothetical protein
MAYRVNSIYPGPRPGTSHCPTRNSVDVSMYLMLGESEAFLLSCYDLEESRSTILARPRQHQPCQEEVNIIRFEQIYSIYTPGHILIPCSPSTDQF